MDAWQILERAGFTREAIDDDIYLEAMQTGWERAHPGQTMSKAELMLLLCGNVCRKGATISASSPCSPPVALLPPAPDASESARYARVQAAILEAANPYIRTNANMSALPVQTSEEDIRNTMDLLRSQTTEIAVAIRTHPEYYDAFVNTLKGCFAGYTEHKPLPPLMYPSVFGLPITEDEDVPPGVARIIYKDKSHWQDLRIF